MYQIEHYELDHPQVVGLTLRAGSMVRVGHGRLWLTQPGQHHDIWLQAGQSWTSPINGQVWISAEPSAQFELAQLLRPWLPSWAHRRAWPMPTIRHADHSQKHSYQPLM